MNKKTSIEPSKINENRCDPQNLTKSIRKPEMRKPLTSLPLPLLNCGQKSVTSRGNLLKIFSTWRFSSMIFLWLFDFLLTFWLFLWLFDFFWLFDFLLTFWRFLRLFDFSCDFFFLDFFIFHLNFKVVFLEVFQLYSKIMWRFLL